MSTDVAAAGTSTATRKRLTVRVVRDQTLDTGRWVWNALPEDYPGCAGGRTIPELIDEVEAMKHFVMDEEPSTEIVVDYVYELEGLPVEVYIAYQHGKEVRDQAAETLRRANEELSEKASATACALRSAGLSLRDGAAVMGISKSRFDQLSSAVRGTGPASAAQASQGPSSDESQVRPTKTVSM